VKIGKGFVTPTGSGQAPAQRAQSRIDRGQGPRPLGVFVRADYKGVTGVVSVRAESKGLICTEIVQNPSIPGSAAVKGVGGGATSRFCLR
jgi:hypothetical protein